MEKEILINTSTKREHERLNWSFHHYNILKRMLPFSLILHFEYTVIFYF